MGTPPWRTFCRQDGGWFVEAQLLPTAVSGPSGMLNSGLSFGFRLALHHHGQGHGDRNRLMVERGGAEAGLADCFGHWGV